MKRKYYYIKVSYMSKVQKGALIRSDATVATKAKLFQRIKFPLADVIKYETDYFKDVAIPESLQIDTAIEISKEDYDAFHQFRESKREPNNKKEENP